MSWPSREKKIAMEKAALILGKDWKELSPEEFREIDLKVTTFGLIAHPNNLWSMVQIVISSDLQRIYSVQVTQDTDKFIAFEQLKIGVAETYID